MKKNLLPLAAIAALSTATQAATYLGNGAGGFGGPIGNGSLTLTDNGTALTGVVTRGGSGIYDSLVIYFDTTAGGATSLPASGEIGSTDASRRSVVNEFGSGISSFGGSFGSDFALTLHPSFGNPVLFATAPGDNANSLVYIDGGNTNLGLAGVNTDTTFTFTILLTQLGITPESGASFSFVSTYVAPLAGGGSDATFRSDEAFSPNGFTGDPNPGFNDVTFSASNTYTTAVPEPASLALVALGSIGLLFRRHTR